MDREPTQWAHGDPITAKRLNELRQALDPTAASNYPTGGKGGVWGHAARSQARRLIGRRQAKPMMGRLSGSSSPYGWQQVVETSSGTFTNGPYTCSACAYEVNGLNGLNNKIVEARLDRFGKPRFRYVRRGTASTCSTGSINVTVRGCSATLQSGASVSITGPGGFSASGTTSGAGTFSASIVGFPAGTYTVVTSKARYVTNTTTVSVACGTVNVNVTISPDVPTYQCSSCAGNANPLPTVLHFTPPFGSACDLTRVSAFGKWVGTSTWTTTPYASCAGNLAGAPETIHVLWEYDSVCNLTGYVWYCYGTNIAPLSESDGPYPNPDTTHDFVIFGLPSGPPTITASPFEALFPFTAPVTATGRLYE